MIVSFGSLGGFLIKLLQGYKLPGGIIIKPLTKKISIPPLVGMIIFGCISRNFFGLMI